MNTENSKLKLKVKNSLAIHSTIFGIVDDVVKEIKKIPKFETKKNDNELLKSICLYVNDELKNSVETDLIKSKQANKIDKVKIIIEALDEVYDLTEEEKAALDTALEFMIDNKVVPNKKVRKSFYSSVNKLFKKLY